MFNGVYKYIKVCLYIFTILIFLLAIFTFQKWGPILTTDTLVYFNLSKQVSIGNFPYSPFYSPGYPFLISTIKSVFNLGFDEAAWKISFVVFIIAVNLTYFIIREFSKERKWQEILFFTLFISLCWWSVKIVFSSHADSLFYVATLIVILSLIKWLKSEISIYFILSSIFAGLSIWIKYNGLIFLPFLVIVPFYYFGYTRKALIGLVPLFTVGGSFIIFKKINGQVIHHLETGKRVFDFWQIDISLVTLINNLSDSGKTIIDFTITSFTWNFFSHVLYICVFLFFSIISIYYLYKFFKTKSIEGVFLLFPIIYAYGYITMSQLTNHTEVNRRTMFPALMFLAFYLLIVFAREKLFTIKILFIVFVSLNLVRSAFGFIDWYKRAPMDSFVSVKEFQKKESLIRLSDIMSSNNLIAKDIYTNNTRYLVPYFDYEWVSSIPVKEKFIRGKFRKVSKEYYDSINISMIKMVDNQQAVIIIFDYNKSSFEFSESVDVSKLIIGGDMILSKF